jgi:hypothetical protein
MSSASAPGSTTARHRSVRPSRFVVRTANEVRSPCGAQRLQPVAAGRRGGCSRSPQPPRPRQRTTTAELRRLAGSDWSEAAPATRPELQRARRPASATSTSSRAPIRWATAQGRNLGGQPVDLSWTQPQATRGGRPKTRETAQDGRAGRFGAHNSSPKQATLVAVLQDFRSRRPDSNRGPLLHEEGPVVKRPAGVL